MTALGNQSTTVDIIDTLPVTALLSWFGDPWVGQTAMQVLLGLGFWTVGDVCDRFVAEGMDLINIENPISGDPITLRLNDQIIHAVMLTIRKGDPRHRFLSHFKRTYGTPSLETFEDLKIVPPDDMQVTIVSEPAPEPVATIVAETPAPAEIPAPEPTKRNGCFFGRLLSYFVDVLHQ